MGAVVDRHRARVRYARRVRLVRVGWHHRVESAGDEEHGRGDLLESGNDVDVGHELDRRPRRLAGSFPSSMDTKRCNSSGCASRNEGAIPFVATVSATASIPLASTVFRTRPHAVPACIGKLGRGADADERTYLLGVRGRMGERDGPADRMAHDERRAEIEQFDQAAQIADELGERHGAARRRPARAAQVVRDDAELLCERRSHLAPERCRCPEPVDENERRSGAALLVVRRHAVSLQLGHRLSLCAAGPLGGPGRVTSPRPG